MSLFYYYPLYTTQNERVWVAVACVCWFVPPVFVVVLLLLQLGVLLPMWDEKIGENDQESWTKTETAAIKLAS